MPQIPQTLSLPDSRSHRGLRLYVAPVAPSAMARFLAQAAKEAREQADRKRYEVSSSPTDRVDPSTIYRFEKGRWPENADRVIDLYASDLELSPIDLWTRALELWREEEESAEAEADQVIAEAEAQAQAQAEG